MLALGLASLTGLALSAPTPAPLHLKKTAKEAGFPDDFAWGVGE